MTMIACVGNDLANTKVIAGMATMLLIKIMNVQFNALRTQQRQTEQYAPQQQCTSVYLAEKVHIQLVYTVNRQQAKKKFHSSAMTYALN